MSACILTSAFGRREGFKEPIFDPISAVGLRRFIGNNMPSEQDLPHMHTSAHPGSQTPGSRSGRTLFALATHPNINTIIVYFMGYAGPNGVYCIAKGLEHKHRRTGVRGRVITADVNEENIARFRRLLRTEGLDGYVQVLQTPVGPRTLLHKGSVDMLAEDMDGSTPLETIDNALRFNAPRVYVSENTRGVGGNHAFKGDYARAQGVQNTVLINADSLLHGVVGRAFSVYVNPRLYAEIRKYYGDHKGCSSTFTPTDLEKLTLNYVGWGHTTSTLAERYRLSLRCVWDIVTCHQHTLCDADCNSDECVTGLSAFE